MAYILYICAGAALGSYISASGSDPPLGRSRCGHCQTILPLTDSVPILSYFYLKGRCGSCNRKIPVIYPVFEILGALFMGGAVYMTENPFLSFILTGTGLLTLLIGYRDGKEGYIYLRDLGILFLFRLALQQFLPEKFSVYLLSVLIAGLIFTLIIRLTGGMGMGDLYYVIILASFFPAPKGTYFFITGSFISGGIIAAAKIIASRKSGKEEMAFAPYLTFSFFLTAIWRSIC